MQEQSDIELLCPKHGEKIVSVSLNETGENQMFCLKCFTQNQIPIQQLTQQLTDLRQQKIKTLMEQQSLSEKRLGQLKTLFLNIKEQFNQGIDNIIKIINDGINIMNQNIKQETEQLKQSIQQINLTQVNQYITELQKQQQKQDDLFIKKDESLRNQTILQYLDLIKQLNNIIKEGSIWKDKVDQNINKEVVVQSTSIQVKGSEQINQQLNQYFLFKQEKGILDCYAIAMDKDQKILINGEIDEIQIWDINQDGTIKLKQTLNGHTEYVYSLCFSQKGYWFISGSDDSSIRIWKKENDQWICQQILENAHQHYVYGIVINNDEDQFISCSNDKTIKVWMKQKNGIQWKCVQTLTEHSYGVLHLSINVDCNLLASSSESDSLRIWQKNKDQSWKLKQVIDYPNDYHARIKFIDNNELIATTRIQGRILRYIQNNKGLFQLKSQLKLNEIKEEDASGFPIIYNKEIKLMIVRHSDQFTYIIRILGNGEFLIHQVLSGDQKAGQILKDGKYIILSNQKNNSLDILK